MRRSIIAVIGLFLLVYVVPLGIRPITIPDETRYAEIPREMIASGDWIVPRLDGFRYFEKPVLGYWVNAVSMILFGENAFAIRLPSALSTGIASMMLFFLVQRKGGGYSAGILTTAVFLTFGAVFAIGTFNVLDGLLAMFITGSMIAFFFAYMEENRWRKNIFLILAGISCGLAFLTKGFVAFAVPFVATVPFMVWERKWKELLKVWWIPTVVACLVAVPWAVLIHIREPDFWRFFIWNEHIRRFVSSHGQHGEPFWFFFLMLPGYAIPWTFLFPAGYLGIRQTSFKEPLIRFSICWLLFPLLFFSTARGKLGTYILPCFPPLAILLETGLRNYCGTGRQKAFKIGVSALLVLGIALAAGAFLVLHLLDLPDLEVLNQPWKYGISLAGFLLWIVFLLYTIRGQGYQRKMMLFSMSPVFLMFIAPSLLPDCVVECVAPEGFLLSHSEMIQPDSILVSGKLTIRAVCWFYKRTDVYILSGGGELSYGGSYEDSKQRLLNPEQFRALVEENRGKKNIFLIEKAKRYRRQRKALPEPIFEDISGDDGFVFARF